MIDIQTFKQLHQQNKPLYLGNVWDVQSALLFEQFGYRAIGTSSTAIAESLGYTDGEEMSFDELYSIVSDIKKRTSIPLSVDIEAGYSRKQEVIVDNINALYDLGVSGINLEDSICEKNSRRIVDPEAFSVTLASIKNVLSQRHIDIFLNVRTDPFIMGLDSPLQQTLARAKMYEKSGADGLFVPCVTEEKAIETIVKSVDLPVNVMAMPNLPAFPTLEKLGVKRISMGPFFYRKMHDLFNQKTNQIITQQSFDDLF